jgi:hypothetical protein
MIFVRGVIFILGIALVLATLFSATATFVLPRAANTLISRFVFRGIRKIFEIFLKGAQTYQARDRILALYAPISLLAMLPIWLTLVALGYSAMFWAAGAASFYEAFRSSGSALLTLGFSTPEGWLFTLMEFTEATIGLMLVALLIAYLPSIYGAFSRREALVTLLEVRAGNPPSAVEMILRFNRIHGLDRLTDQWQAWEVWFADIEESHTSLSALVFFRSPQPEHSWVTAAGAVLDAAALTRSSIDIPTDPTADLCIRAGYLALRHIADFFRLSYDKEPHFPAQPVSITRLEFEAALDTLSAGGVPVKGDRNRAWSDFAGWRVNYDTVLNGLARITEAAPAPWLKSQH